MSDTAVIPSKKSTDEAVATLLFVDDESKILSALERLFRPLGYRIFTALSGALGLEIMEREAVDLVVSDMRMPNMNGAEFLEKVNEKWPKTVRILLTGYAEINATIDAINKGQVYRYIAKPWEDNDVALVIKHALHMKALERDKVNHEALKISFIASIRIFANIIEMREGNNAGPSRRVAELARSIAQQMGLNDKDVQDVFVAGLLHNVGKISLPDRVTNKPFDSLDKEERVVMMTHPIKGEAILMEVEALQGAAKLIRAHQERYDGMGYPDRLTNLEIPMGARILALVADYYATQFGFLLSYHLNQADARSFILEGQGHRYDPHVVKAFISAISTKEVK